MSTDRPGHPHARSALAAYLDKRIDELKGVKTQREIAAEAGFSRPNIISMLKFGETQTPLDKIPGLARALDADPAHLFRLAMEDRWPGMKATIAMCFGKQMATANEAAIFIEKWRIASCDLDPAPDAEINAAVDALLTQLFGS